MFGHRYFGARYFGARYFGPALAQPSPTPTPTPTPAGGATSRFKRKPVLKFAETPQEVFVRGSVSIVEGADRFFAVGQVYESEAQIKARQRAKVVRVLVLA